MTSRFAILVFLDWFVFEKAASLDKADSHLQTAAGVYQRPARRTSTHKTVDL
jgi:hypothetical protein